MPANILNLSQYTVLSVKNTEADYHIEAEIKIGTTHCTYCKSTELVGFGKRERLVKDLPIHGRRVGIYVSVRRIKCKSCAKTFSEQLPDVDTKRFMTKRLLDWIGKSATCRTFTSIAEEVGIVEGTVRSILKDYVNELQATV